MASRNWLYDWFNCLQKHKIYVCSVFFAIVLVSCTYPSPPPTTVSQAAYQMYKMYPSLALINFAHLDFLSEEVKINGKPMILTHIYSEYPNYDWVDAPGEGIAAVDDVARAAIVYLNQYEITKDRRMIEKARRALNFVRYMQANDGEFYNFVVDRAGTINRTGITSYKSLDWWAMRALWALARGYATFKRVDPVYASELREAYLRTERALKNSIPESHVGKTIKVHGFDMPAWLPGGAADRTSIAILALAEYYQAEPNEDTAKLLAILADGVAAFQLGGPGVYPFSMHPDTINAPGFWHAWGSHQSQALARAGRVMQRRDWIDSAAREADTFFAWQLVAGLIKEIGVIPVREGQIAYGVNTLVQAFMELYHATNNPAYARMGGLTASWFFGNNFAQTPMYDPQTGRGYDGIDAALRVNLNAGAESTIEALMALQAVAVVPEAARFLGHKAKSHATGWQVIEAEYGTEVAGKPIYGRRGWTGEANMSNGRYYELRKGDAIEIPFDVPASGEYWLYAAHMRRAPLKPELGVEATLAQGVTIDARFDEPSWSSAPTVSSNQPDQILRGAQFWRGPDKDSFDLRVMWDADKLYLAIEVRDSLPGTDGSVGPSGEDAIWIYLDGRGDGNRLSAKFTIGHTDKGTIAWDWRAGFWLPKAEVARRSIEGGYVYEAAIPWASLGVREVKPNQRMGIEVGRGIGGNSFMNLSGRDPDAASNLVPLTLVIQPGRTGRPQDNMSVAAMAPDSVAFSVSINNSITFTVPQAVSPDRDYLWLDRVNSNPLQLERGSNTLRVSYSGSDPDRAALVDAFLLLPAVLTREFTSPAGERLTLRYDLMTGRLTWEE